LLKQRLSYGMDKDVEKSPAKDDTRSDVLMIHNTSVQHAEGSFADFVIVNTNEMVIAVTQIAGKKYRERKQRRRNVTRKLIQKFYI